MAIRYYSSTAQQTTLTASVTPSGTTVQVASTTGFPGPTPFTLALDYGAANEELVDVTAVAGFSLTVTRSVDGTPASSHNAGAFVRHVSSARDFTEFQQHINGSTNVHGLAVGSAVVGTTDTQTLTNKTLTKAHGSLENVDLYNLGAGQVTSVIGDSTNLTANRMNWLRDEVSLTPLITFNSSGGGIFAKSATDADNIYKFRVVEDVGGADRAAILAGGTMTLAPTTTTGFVPVDVVAPDTSGSKRTIRVAASGGGTERFTVWNDGHVDITGQNPTFATLDVTGAAAQSASYFRVMNSAAVNQFSVQANGNTLAGETMDVRNNSGAATTVPLRVYGNTTSQTGDLQQWIDQFGLIQARITSTGQLISASTNNSGAAVATAASGWSLTAAVVNVNAGTATISFALTLTGAPITAAANGNLSPDVSLATIAAAYLPNAILGGRLITAMATDGGGSGATRMNAGTGLVELVTWGPGVTIATGNVVQLSMTYTL